MWTVIGIVLMFGSVLGMGIGTALMRRGESQAAESKAGGPTVPATEALVMGDVEADRAVVEDDEHNLTAYRDAEREKYARRVQMHLDQTREKVSQ